MSYDVDYLFDSEPFSILAIPYIQFEPEWKIKIIPSNKFSICKFIINYNNIVIDVWLNFYSHKLRNEDFFPYWKIYPFIEEGGRVEIFALNDTKGMMTRIKEIFAEEAALTVDE